MDKTPPFSQRFKCRPVNDVIQTESLSAATRQRIWNHFNVALWQTWNPSNFDVSYETNQISILLRQLWLSHFNQDFDDLPNFRSTHGTDGYLFLKTRFFEADWYDAYDLLEFIINYRSPTDPKDHLLSNSFISGLNKILERELCGYRVVNRRFILLTDKSQIDSIEGAMNCPCDSARIHLDKALRFLSDKTSPDPRNSVKESISAVEAVCREISGSPKATLRDALKQITSIHPALSQSFNKLYGYTSDESGIRHAITDDTQSPVDFPTALFMLVACSAFISYLYTAKRT